MKYVAVINLRTPQWADGFGVPRLVEGSQEPRRPVQVRRAGRFRAILGWRDCYLHTGPGLKRDTGDVNLTLIFHGGGCFVRIHGANPNDPGNPCSIISW